MSIDDCTYNTAKQRHTIKKWTYFGMLYDQIFVTYMKQFSDAQWHHCE